MLGFQGFPTPENKNQISRIRKLDDFFQINMKM